MFTKTRVHFLLVSLGILCFLFLGLTTIFYVTSREKETSDRNQILNEILTENSLFNSSKSFLVTVESDKIKVTSYDTSFYTEQMILNLVHEIMDKESLNGSMDNLHYISNSTSPTSFKLAGIDRSAEKANLKYYLISLIFIESLILTLLGTFLWLVSKWVVSPLEESIKKQKQFISDASHELKTPLTIISASAEVLRSEVSNENWIDSIEEQVSRLNELINQLITLSVLDESKESIIKEDVNLSNLLNLSLLPYEAVVYEKNKILILDIDPEIVVSGNKATLKQLISIFIDNAIKYSDDEGQIKVSLYDKKHPKLRFYNTGCDITQDKRESLFDRFYRTDESRNSEKKGFGLGLSIARRICDQYGYTLKLEAKYQEYTTFTILF